MDPEGFGTILRTLLAQGFELPLQIVTLGANGSVMAGKWSVDEERDGLAFELSVEHVADGYGFAVPVNMMIVDARGEAARVHIDRGGEAEVILN